MRTAASHSSSRTCSVEADARRDLDDLLMPPLHRAVALVQVEHVAVLVAEDLHLDVLGARNVLFEKHRGIAERAARFALRLVEQIRRDRRPCCTTRIPRPPPPNAALMMSGKPISFATFSASVAIGRPAPRCRASVGTPSFLRQRAGGGLVAHHVEQLRARSDEGDARLGAGPGELRRSPTGNRSRDGSCPRPFPCASATMPSMSRYAPTGPFARADEIGLVRLEAMHRRAGPPARRSRRCGGPVRSRRGRCGWRFRCDWRRAVS